MSGDSPKVRDARFVRDDFALGSTRRKKSIEVGEFCEGLRDSLKIIEVLANDGLKRAITRSDINRPGLALTGFFDTFSDRHLQVLGRTELSYIGLLEKERMGDICARLCSYSGIPCFIFTRGLEPPPDFLDNARSAGIPVILSRIKTTEAIAVISDYLRNEFASVREYHGDLIDVYGMGVLIIGEAAVGKSECALDLVSRGHCLVADDRVIVKRISAKDLIGSCSPLAKGLVGIQGIGIFNVAKLFGARATRSDKRIDILIKIEELNKEAYYDLTGHGQMYTRILGVEIPYIVIPIVPGKSIATLIEVAALNEILKRNGADDLDRLDDLIANKGSGG